VNRNINKEYTPFIWMLWMSQPLLTFLIIWIILIETRLMFEQQCMDKTIFLKNGIIKNIRKHDP